jgi:serine protease
MAEVIFLVDAFFRDLVMERIALWMFCLFISVCDISHAGQQAANELIVGLKPYDGLVENLDKTIHSINTGQDRELRKRLSGPINARPFLRSYNRTKYKSKTPVKDKRKSPKELLEGYLVLTYSDRNALVKAKMELKKDSSVLWVGENTSAILSALPNDPLVTPPPVLPGPGLGEQEYQWALNLLNIPKAWDYSRGHAYVSMIDVGIQTDHPDLIANFRDQFSVHINSSANKNSLNVDEAAEFSSQQLLNDDIRMGHGTHVAGIIAAEPNNSIGVAGICGNCSLMANKTADVYRIAGFGSYHVLTWQSMETIANNIVWLTDTGAQVINMSFRLNEQVNNNSCLDDVNHVLCLALKHSDDYDVMMVAAAGNNGLTTVDFPASDPRVIGVGAVNINGQKPAWSNTGVGIDLAAPGEDVLSTVYTDRTWIEPEDKQYFPSGSFLPECGDKFSAPSGYGPCSGTSMAAPHVTGIAGILRSINPLLSKSQIKELLVQHARRASQADAPDPTIGYGVPDAAASVKAAMGTVGGKVLKNRLTPLFSLYSSDGEDHLYTTVPQMAMAAIYGSLRPQPGISYFEKPEVPVQWRSVGDIWAGGGYTSFPLITWMPSEPPKASVYIFTTYNNPLDPENELVPLYRLSNQGNYTGSNPRNIDHTYTTEQAGIEFFEEMAGKNYKLDGIEGYIYPRNLPTQPAGTVKLYRKYNPERDDHAIFPESELAIMEAQGYTENSGNDWIGYVYPNQDSDYDHVIDGFETIIGTNPYNPDSDDDGVSDGVEIVNYPYSDPKSLTATSVLAQTTPNEVTSNWYSLNYSETFSDNPVLLIQLQSFDGGDTASIRMRAETGQGVELRIEEEASRDNETGHTSEVVGLLGVTPGEIIDSTGRVIGEAGFITANTTGNAHWRSLNFSGSYTNPIVVMNMVTYNGNNPSHIRLKNVSADGAEFQIEEWDYLDQSHTAETMAYLVLEQGEFTLAEGRQLRVGTTSTTHAWQQVAFRNMGAKPVIFSQCQTYRGGQAVVTRQRNLGSSGFEVRLQEEEANGGHAAESIGYIAVQ